MDKKSPWKAPEWMIKNASVLSNPMHIVEKHMNMESNINVITNAPLALMVIATKSEVALLERMYKSDLIKNNFSKI